MAESKAPLSLRIALPEVASAMDRRSTMALLCESAEAVLRGGPVWGPLALVEDVCARRRAAVELMQMPASVDVREAWLPSYPELQRHAAPLVDVDDHSCPCGTSILTHQEDDMPLTPLCWHLFATSVSLSIQQRIHRSQAVAQFAWAIFHVVRTAHGEGPFSRISAAWQVIDGIDSGERLIPALAAFFRVSRAAIRASRSLSLGSAYLDALPTRARRVLRASWELRRWPDIDGGSKDDLARWLPVLDLISRKARHSIVLLGRTLPLRAVEIMVVRETTKAERRALLRWIIRRSRNGVRDAVKDWQELLLRWRSGSGSPDRVNHPVPITLGDAWLAIPLRDAYDLWLEGHQMGHCVFSLRHELERGKTTVYSVRAARTRESVTVAFTRCPDRGSVPAFCLEARGPRNGAISLEAMQAVLDLLRIIERSLAPRRLRVVIGHS